MRDNGVGDIVPHQREMVAVIIKCTNAGDANQRQNKTVFDRSRTAPVAQQCTYGSSHLAFPVLSVPAEMIRHQILRIY